jgi:predicted proteasome-type protease
MFEYAELSELVYYAQEEARKVQELKREETMKNNIKFDLSFLVDIALDNKDQDLFNWCMEVNK